MPSVWASRPALTRWKSGWGTRRSAAPGSARASATISWVSGPNGSRCWSLVVRVLRSVSWRVHSWSERTAFQGSSMICSPSSIALARTTSSSAVSSATLPISLRYIRTGSSIPIMSAERASASSSSVVGSSTSAADSFAGASRSGGTGTLSITSSVAISTARVAMSGSASSGPGEKSSSSSSGTSTRGSVLSPASGAAPLRGRWLASFTSSRSRLERRVGDRMGSRMSSFMLEGSSGLAGAALGRVAVGGDWSAG